MNKPYFDSHGNFISEFPEECVADCSAPGSVDESVEHWRAKLEFDVPIELAIRWLKSTGGWTEDELRSSDDWTIARRVLWLACCDVRENGEWFGLVN